MKIGVFGGTFDPVHIGHLIVAQDAYTALGLDRVLFVPAAQPPHKRDRRPAAPELRLEMLRDTLAADPRFEPCDVELRRSGPSYTVDTLRELRERYTDATLYLLIGTDQFREFDTWHESEAIVRLARMIVISREGKAGNGTPGAGAAGDAGHSGGDVSMDSGAGHGDRRDSALPDVAHERIDATRIDVSATEIRRRVAAGEPFRYLVPDAARRVIEREGLYGDV